MTQERFNELHLRKERLNHIRDQRQSTYDAVSTGEVQFGQSIRSDLKIGRVKEKLTQSVAQYSAKIDATEEEIRSLENQSSLIDAAQSYLDELQVRRLQSQEFVRYASAGHIPTEVLERRQEEFRVFEARQVEDEELKRGLELLREREEKIEQSGEAGTEEVRTQGSQVAAERKEGELASVKVHWRERKVEIDGREVVFSSRSKITWAVFMRIAKNANSDVSFSEIEMVATRAGSEASYPAGNSMSALRDIIEDDAGNPKLIEHKGSKVLSRYVFHGDVEFIGEPPRLEISESSNLIRLESEEIELTERQAKVLRVLAKMANSESDEVLSRDLSSDAFGDSDVQGTRLRVIIPQLKRLLNREDMPDVLFSKMAAQNSWTALKGGDIIFVEKTEEGFSSQQPEVPVETKPHGSREVETREFELPDGTKVEIKGPVRIKYFERLLETSEQSPVSSDDLAEEFYGESDQYNRDKVASLISRINAESLKFSEWRIFQPVTHGERARGARGRYFLRKLEGQTEEEVEVSAKREPIWKNNPVQEDRLRALEWIIDNPKSDPGEVTEMLSPDRRGRRLTRNNASFALANAGAFLVLRQREGLITDEELPTLAKLQRFYEQSGFERPKDFRIYLHGRFFPSKSETVEVKDKEIAEVTVKDATVLATLFYLKGDLLEEAGVEPIPEDIPRSLSKKMQNKGSVEIEDLDSVRREIVQKLTEAVRNGSIDEVFDSSDDEDVRSTIVYFLEYSRVQENVSEGIFGEPDRYWQAVNSEVIRVWDEWEIAELGEGIDSGELEGGIEAVTGMIAVDSDDSEVDIGIGEGVDVSSATTGETQERKHLSPMEKRYPEVQKKINDVKVQVDEKIVSEPATLRQVAREFNNLSRSEVDRLTQQGIINPEIRGGGPVFTKAEIVLMLYVKRHGNGGLSPRMVRDLRKIVNKKFEEEEQQQNRSGK